MNAKQKTWDELSESQRYKLMRDLKTNYRCYCCDGELVIHNDRTWVLHEVWCPLRRRR